MKKLVLFIILFVLTINSSAQYWISKHFDKSLSELNSEELSFLHEKSRKTAVTGGVLAIAGSGVMVGAGISGIVRAVNDVERWDYSGDTFYIFMAVAFYTGLAATAVGLTTFMVGSTHKNIIRKARNNLQQNALIQIIPSVRQINPINGYSKGFTISMTF